MTEPVANPPLPALEFIVASMTVHVPHEYTVRRADDARAFDILRAAIREHGVTVDWRGRRYRYLVPGDGYRYWEILSGVINRATN